MNSVSIDQPDDWAPMPRKNETLFGLRRGKLYTLAVPCAANNFKPPVLSKSVPGPEKKTRGDNAGKKAKRRSGSRIVNIPSLRAYVLGELAPAKETEGAL